jgi:modulator of FtsH protease
VNPTIGWTSFLSAETGAAAALAGLIFVAVSINVVKILQFPAATTRAFEALALLMGVLFLGTFGLAPYQSPRTLGYEFLGVGVVLWVMFVILHAWQVRTARKRVAWYWLVNRIALCQFATLPFCISGILLIRGNPQAMYWLIPGCIFSFASAMSSAWVLLIEILR